jgi:hypothetical protein
MPSSLIVEGRRLQKEMLFFTSLKKDQGEKASHPAVAYAQQSGSFLRKTKGKMTFNNDYHIDLLIPLSYSTPTTRARGPATSLARAESAVRIQGVDACY